MIRETDLEIKPGFVNLTEYLSTLFRDHYKPEVVLTLFGETQLWALEGKQLGCDQWSLLYSVNRIVWSLNLSQNKCQNYECLPSIETQIEN